MKDTLKGWDEFEEQLIYDRYSIRDPKTGKRLEKTFEDVIGRIANYILSKNFPVDKEIIETALVWFRKRKLTFATPALMNLGNPYVNRKGYYSCFTLGPVPDSTKEILEYVNTCATIFQYAGGSGLDFSKLRAKNSPVDGNQGVSSGPCSFIELFEKVSGVIAAGGKRRGAELAQLDYNHPDIFDFVKLKQTNSNLSAVNISVNVFDGFWKNEKLIDEIAKGMWLTGDPGLLFPDEMSINSPYPSKWKSQVRYVNPCGEHCSPPFSICNLLTGSAITCNPKTYIPDFERLGYYMTYLGNCILWITIINNNGEGLPKESIHYKKMLSMITELRPIGIGLTGLAEFLHYVGYEYGNIEIISEIYAALTRGSLLASHEWYKATGDEAIWDDEYKYNHLKKIGYGSQYTKFWNTITTCQAPAGSVSQFLRCISTGIEPLSSAKVIRSFYGPDNQFHDVELISTVLDENVKLEPVSVEDQLKVTSTIQSLLHTSASKTINVPEETTVEDIKKIIYQAKEYKIKGLTVYRMGCSLDAIVKDDNKKSKFISNKKLPDIRKGNTFKFRGMNSLYITVNLCDNKPVEVFMAAGKSGNVVNGLCMGLGRLTSLALRSGTSIKDIIKSVGEISTGDFYVNKKLGRVTSICDALSRALQFFVDEKEVVVRNVEDNQNYFDLCPQCGNFTLMKIGSCKSCSRCNFSTC